LWFLCLSIRESLRLGATGGAGEIIPLYIFAAITDKNLTSRYDAS
jgi:hypothetical protein